MLTQFIINTADTADMQAQLRAALHAGCSWVEIKAAGTVSDADISATIEMFRAEMADKNMVLILADRYELAKEIKADGVHIYNRDIPLSRIRNYLEAWPILGVSVAGAADIESLQGHDIDYIFYSPALPSGLDEISAIAAKLQDKVIECPLVAAGGINHDNYMKPVDAGADAVAIDRAFCHSEDLSTSIHNFINNTSSCQ